jgi:hypothetical protein
MRSQIQPIEEKNVKRLSWRRCHLSPGRKKAEAASFGYKCMFIDSAKEVDLTD